MKNTTQQIFNLIQSENFTKLADLREKVTESGWANTEYQEMLFTDAYGILTDCINTISNSLSGSNNTFENLASFSDRSQILSYVQNINSYIQNTKNGTNQIINFIQQVQLLEQIIRSIKLELNINGYPSYQEKLVQVRYLKQKYEELISKLDKGQELYDQLELILSNANKDGLTVSAILKGTQSTEQEIKSSKSTIEQLQSDISQSNKNIISYEAEVKQNADAIKSFFQQIEENNKKMKEGLEKVTNTIASSASEMIKKIQEYEVKTKAITDKNQELQNDIKGILGAAVGTNLYKSFNQKAFWMLWQSIFWLIVLVGSIWFLSDTGKYIFESLRPFFENGKISDLTLTFYLRLTLIFPAIYSVYFSASEFKNTNKLREEYDFKSSVAVALHYFKELVDDSKDDKEGTQKFLIEAIQNIFQSPTDKAFGKQSSDKEVASKAKDIVSDIASITGDIANKILPSK